MNTQIFLNLIDNPLFLLFFSSFAGSFIGEFNRECNRKRKIKFILIIRSFILSWFVSYSTTLLLCAILKVDNNILIAISILLGILGDKEVIKYIRKFINKKID